MGIFIGGKTYSSDLNLFKQLGLEPFNVKNNKEHFVGKFDFKEYENTTVDIFVSCYPAQFWRFVVKCSEGEKYEIQTGSGGLSNYWSTIELFATNMISCKSIK